jgi:hypothetical protein
MASSVYSRTLQKAVELMGSRAKLCRYLHVPTTDLDQWLSDEKTPPLGVFLRTVDLVIEETSPPRGSEPGDPPSPREGAASGSSACGPLSSE